MDLLHLGMSCQIFYHFQCVFCMTLYSERKGLQSLEEEKRMEGRYSSPGIPKKHSPDIGYKGSLRRRLCKNSPVVTGIGLRDPGYLPESFQSNLPAVHDNPAQGCSMASDKFRSGMDHNVRSIFYGPHQVRCSKCRIYDQGNVMLVGDLGQLFQIRHIRMGISQSLCKDCFVFSRISFSKASSSSGSAKLAVIPLVRGRVWARRL